MVLSRSLVLVCVAAVVVLSEAPGAGVGAELVPRQLKEEVVKVHVKVHKNKPETVATVSQAQSEDKKPRRKQNNKHHKKVADEKVAGNDETVRMYSHGTVRIDSKATEATKKQVKSHQDTKKETTNENVVEYKHGSVKTSSKKDNGKAKVSKKKAEKAGNEKEVASTANEVTELVTKLSSTTPTDQKSFIDAYGPVVVICGIIGALAAIVGVAGLVVGHSQSIEDVNFDSVLDDSADVDVDVEANVCEKDAAADDKDLLSDSDSEANDDEDEEATFVNSTAHVSV